MGASTGPILAAGGVTASVALIQREPPEALLRIGVATGIAAATLALLEQASPRVAAGLAWAALITTFFVPHGTSKLTPFELFDAWYSGKVK